MNFIVFTRQRTGSTYFCNVLESHPDVLSHGELILNRTHLKKLGEEVQPIEDYFQSMVDPNKVTGFKLMANQIFDYMADGMDVLLYIKKYRPKIIKLIRNNFLAVYTSLLRGVEHKIASSRQYENNEKIIEELKDKQIYVDPKKVISNIEFIKYEFNLIDTFVKLLDLECIEVKYTDAVTEFKSKEFVCSFLGIDSKYDMYCHDHLKTSHSDFRKSIENYDEIRSLLVDKYPDFLDKEFSND